MVLAGFQPARRRLEQPAGPHGGFHRRRDGSGLTAHDVHDRAIVGAILGVGLDLGLDIVAEGIETPAQAAELIRLGCPSGQGYLYGRPAAASQLFASRSWRVPRLAPAAGE